MLSRFSVRVDSTDEGSGRVRAIGEIDANTAESLGRAVEVACADGVDVVLVDLRGVTFCDGAGVGTLVYQERRARQRGIDLRIRPSRLVRRALDLTGVSPSLRLEPLAD